MKVITISFFLLLCTGSFAQNTIRKELDKEIHILNERIESNIDKTKLLDQKNKQLEIQLKQLNDQLKIEKLSTENQLVEINNRMDKGIDSLYQKMAVVEKQSNSKIQVVDSTLGTTTNYGVIGLILLLVFIILLSILIYLLSKRQKLDKNGLIEQMSNTKLSIEENLVVEFGKQTELMDSLLEIIKKANQSAPSNHTVLDHSLALKVASEINLIARNIGLMDVKTRGLKQLQASVNKLKDNLAANGYEIPELLGKPYHQGMNIIVVNSIPDENLEKGVELITKILIPQVNFNQKMIQTAQIEVSIG